MREGRDPLPTVWSKRVRGDIIIITVARHPVLLGGAIDCVVLTSSDTENEDNCTGEFTNLVSDGMELWDSTYIHDTA